MLLRCLPRQRGVIHQGLLFDFVDVVDLFIMVIILLFDLARGLGIG
jgi:hypothetical protein